MSARLTCPVISPQGSNASHEHWAELLTSKPPPALAKPPALRQCPPVPPLVSVHLGRTHQLPDVSVGGGRRGNESKRGRKLLKADTLPLDTWFQTSQTSLPSSRTNDATDVCSQKQLKQKRKKGTAGGFDLGCLIPRSPFTGTEA